MDTATNESRIDYIEFPATDIAKTRAFYTGLFGWKFTDYGPDYTSFADGRLAGGFFTKDTVTPGGALVVIFSTDLAGMQAKVQAAGGAFISPILRETSSACGLTSNCASAASAPTRNLARHLTRRGRRQQNSIPIVPVSQPQPRIRHPAYGRLEPFGRWTKPQPRGRLRR